MGQAASELANRLLDLDLPILPDQAIRFCKTSESDNNGKLGGCQKYHECNLHPDEYKDVRVEDLPTKVREQLKAVNCLRTQLFENPHLVAESREVALGEYIGALPDRSDGDRDQTGDGELRHCPYHGCVVPELEKLRPSAADRPPFANSCPFERERTRDGRTRQNIRRYTACNLTRVDTLRFMERFKIATIAPICVMPGSNVHHDLYYMGKSLDASFQFVALNPDASYRAHPTLPQEQARQHAPRLVRQPRQISEDGLWHAHGVEQTITSFNRLNKPHGLSAFERAMACRYIPAGEFVFLCLMWFWSGERAVSGGGAAESAALAYLTTAAQRNKRTAAAWGPTQEHLKGVREVCLENAQYDLGEGNEGPCLLRSLSDLGLLSEVETIFGAHHKDGPPDNTAHDILISHDHGQEFTRRSSRLEDMLRLRILIARSGARPSVKLGRRAEVITDWLQRAVATMGNQTQDPLDPCSPARSRQLLVAEDGYPAWQDFLSLVTKRLGDAIRQDQATLWLIAFDDFLKELNRRFESLKLTRKAYREFLRDEGFPVYPMVHVTMLTGLSAPLDWIAIPLGGTVRMDDDSRSGDTTPRYRAQAAFFVLSEARPVQDAKELVGSLRQLLAATTLPLASQMADEVVNRTTRLVQSAVVANARIHRLEKSVKLAEKYVDPAERRRVLKDLGGDPVEIDRVSDLLGQVISAGKIISRDNKDLQNLVRQRFSERFVDRSVKALLEHAVTDLRPLEAMEGREFQWLGDSAESVSVRVQLEVTRHLLQEALTNSIVHDPAPGSRIPIQVSSAPDWVKVDICNPNHKIPTDSITRFQELEAKFTEDRLPELLKEEVEGHRAMLALAIWSGCSVELLNEFVTHLNKDVGITRVTFRVART